MPASLQIEVNPQIYLKNPLDTELGKNIVSASIELIDDIGFEKFTFKKLAAEINSTEASVYRYFKSKHKLLAYLISWYWGWLEYLLEIKTMNITDPKEKIRIMAAVLSDSVDYDPNVTHIDESKLFKIAVAESAKAYVAKDIQRDLKGGTFEGYQALCDTIADCIKSLNPRYPRRKALASSIVAMAHRQSFYAEYMPSLTELKRKRGSNKEVAAFIEEMILKVVKG